MKTFIADIFPKIQLFSEKLDDITLLTNQSWVNIDNIAKSKTVYFFRNNSELLISTNGRVQKARWEYLGNKSLLLDIGSDSYLFKLGFKDQNILALKIDSSEEYAVFVNENKYGGELNTFDKVIDFLAKEYLKPDSKRMIELVTGHQLAVKKKPIIIKTQEQLKKEKKDDEVYIKGMNQSILWIGIIIVALVIGYYVLRML